MNFNVQGTGMGNNVLDHVPPFMWLVWLFSAVVTILFVVSAWRAMKAHEKIANNLEIWVQHNVIKDLKKP